MQRRRFMASFAGGILAVPLVAEAQQATAKMAKIGVLFSATVASMSVEMEPFKQTHSGSPAR